MDRVRRRDRGETLVEILIAVVIMGIAISALITGIAASSRAADLHRDQADAAHQLVAAAEAVRATSYVATCPADVPSGQLTALATYEAKARLATSDEWDPLLAGAIEYWNPETDAFDGTCRESAALSGGVVSTAAYTTSTNRYTEITLSSGTVNASMQGMQIDFSTGGLSAASAALITTVGPGNTLTFESLSALPSNTDKFDVLPRNFQRMQQVRLTLTLPRGGTTSVTVAKRSQT